MTSTTDGGPCQNPSFLTKTGDFAMTLTTDAHRYTPMASTGFTCFLCCLRTAKNARSRVPLLCSGVCWFFDFVEKPTNPTRMGNVREPGSRTFPQVSPVEVLGACFGETARHSASSDRASSVHIAAHSPLFRVSATSTARDSPALGGVGSVSV